MDDRLFSFSDEYERQSIRWRERVCVYDGYVRDVLGDELDTGNAGGGGMADAGVSADRRGDDA